MSFRPRPGLYVNESPVGGRFPLERRVFVCSASGVAASAWQTKPGQPWTLQHPDSCTLSELVAASDIDQVLDALVDLVRRALCADLAAMGGEGV